MRRDRLLTRKRRRTREVRRSQVAIRIVPPAAMAQEPSVAPEIRLGPRHVVRPGSALALAPRRQRDLLDLDPALAKADHLDDRLEIPIVRQARETHSRGDRGRHGFPVEHAQRGTRADVGRERAGHHVGLLAAGEEVEAA